MSVLTTLSILLVVLVCLPRTAAVRFRCYATKQKCERYANALCGHEGECVVKKRYYGKVASVCYILRCFMAVSYITYVSAV